MYEPLLIFHSLIRWVLILGLLISLSRSLWSFRKGKPFSRVDNILRAVVSGTSHTQLILGFLLYFKSPVTQYFLQNEVDLLPLTDITFFGVMHISCMVVSVLLVTIGSASAKRAAAPRLKHRAVLLWFGMALTIILIAIPWPFSPLASRPLFRI